MDFFIALSFENRDKIKPVISVLEDTLQRHGHNSEAIAYRNLEVSSNSEMMKVAFDEVSKSDVLIAEGSTKEVGVGIEMGMAYAEGKKIILIKEAGSEDSTTMSGVASFPVIKYTDVNDLKRKFEDLLSNMSEG